MSAVAKGDIENPALDACVNLVERLNSRLNRAVKRVCCFSVAEGCYD